MASNPDQSPKRARPRSRRGRSAPKAPIVRVDISVAPPGAQAVKVGAHESKVEAAPTQATPQADPRLVERLRALEAECRRLEAELASAKPPDLDLRRLQRRADELASREEALDRARAELAEREATLEERQARLDVDLELREEALEERAKELEERERRLDRRQTELAAYVGQLQGRLRVAG